MYIASNQDDFDTVHTYINSLVEGHNSFIPSYALIYKTPTECRTQLGFS